jgi:lipopolysaccharide export system permease protein
LSLLDRYLLRQFFGPFWLSIAGFTIVGAIDILFLLIEIAVSAKIPALTVLKLLAFKLPGVMLLFFPMSVLFSVMFVLVRMAKDTELTVLRTSGIHYIRIVFPLLLAGAIAMGLAYALNEVLVPESNRAYESSIRTEVQRLPAPDLIEDTIFKDADRFFYIKSIHNNQLSQVYIFEKSPAYPRITTAESAVWTGHSWNLKKGRVYEINQTTGRLYSVNTFDTATIHVDQFLTSFLTPQKAPHEMDSYELGKEIQAIKKGGGNPRSLMVEYHLKKSLPAACMVFGVMGIALCVLFVQTGRDWWGVVISILAAILCAGFYFFLVAVLRAVSKDGSWNPLITAWLPNVLYLTLGSVIMAVKGIYKS